MIFWLTSGALALGVAVLMGIALVRRMPDGGPERSDLTVYRDQLAAVDRDLARGVATEDEAERLRTEIKRRLLDADRNAAPVSGHAPEGVTLAVGAVSVLVVVGGSLLLYAGLGAPGYPDMPFDKRIELAAERAATRPSQAIVEARTQAPPPPEPSPEFVSLVDRLRATLEARPDDADGLRLLARNEAGLGNYGAAAAAQSHLVAVLGASASAQDHAALAELTLLAEEGRITDVVTQALDTALSLDSAQPMARYFSDLIASGTATTLPLPGVLARQGDLVGAHQAQAELLALLGDRATAADHADHADLMILAAGGYVSPEAEAALTLALEGDPQNGTARYYQGLLHSQTGRPDLAFRIWEGLLRSSPPGAPWLPPIQAQIAQVAAEAGIDYRPEAPGAAAPGPDAGQVAAAQDMSPAERMEMIEGMVTGLAERLATEGGTAEDWARLIRAYGVLGRTDAAARVWAEAQTVFPDDVTRVPILQAARDAGVEQ